MDSCSLPGARLHDRCDPVRLDAQPAHVVYVDNFCAFSKDRAQAESGQDRVRREAERRGLVVHETFCDSEFELLGLLYDGIRGQVRLTQKRVWRLLQGLRGLLRSGRCSGKSMQRVVGTATWGMLLNRPLLSILSSVYPFSMKEGVRGLWRSTRRELTNHAWASAFLQAGPAL